MDNPQDIHLRMLHTSLKCDQHHHRRTRICAERVCYTSREESNDDNDDVQMVITQMAALMTRSQLMASTAAETSASVTAAIKQLAANQQAMQQEFAAFATARNTMYQPATPTPPPVQFNIPNFGTFQPAGLGVGGRQGGHGRGEQANAGRQGRTPFANFMGRGGQGGLPPIGGGRGGGVAPFTQQNAPCIAAPMYSNIIKWYANWNVCFSCGFDVENGHTSKTCPAPWTRVNHQEGYTYANFGQYISAGYDVCTKVMHKSQLPTI